MKQFINSIISPILFSVLISCSSTITNTSVLDYVDPFIGTAGHGHTFPGATMPFGMVQLSPDTGLSGWDWCSGYHYSDSSIIGFSHTHLSGTGRSDLMDIMFMPTVGELILEAGSKENPDKGYRSRFSHESEYAEPGYYKVNLLDYKVQVELTATIRCGMQRYTFPKSLDAHVILDLSHHYATDNIVTTSLRVIDNQTIAGMRKTRGWGEGDELYWSDQQIYFVAKFSKPFDSLQIFSDNIAVDTDKSIEGDCLKAVIDYQTYNGEEVLVKVGISPVSEKNALLNLETEIGDQSFKQIKTNAQNVWTNELSKIIAEGNHEEKTKFYTALYHSLIAPYTYSDVNNEYLGSDKKIHSANGFTNYTVMSLWDTFRAQNPLLTLVAPNRVNDIVHSMLAQYDQYGLLPVWSLWSSETNCMIGYHSIPVIVDAYFKGICDYDIKKAFEAMKASAMQNDFGINCLKEYNYIPYDKYNKSVSTALEYCFDDWCIAQIAKDLNQTSDYKYFMQRAGTYKKYFDPEYQLMNGISSDGKYRRPFDPFYSSYGECDWVEGNSWQYSFFAPHDIDGLIALYGGNQKFIETLDKLFTLPANASGDDIPLDMSGFIGQYVHGNEPSHQVAYLYNMAGDASKGEKRLHEIMTTLYTTSPDGLCGNEDCGQMSAWYVFSAMGFYPVNPADQKYIFGTPLLDKASITVKDKCFTMIANNRTSENIYVQSITLNGKAYAKNFISHKDIVDGGTLVFEMGSQP